jgi:LAO/AO transport system kinase
LHSLTPDIQRWIAKMLEGDPVSCGRLLTVVESMDQQSDAILAELFGRIGSGYRIGLTGPPGAGKSTLCLHLARNYRQRGRRVGVVAVDPSSPLSGGALLGDRIRLGEMATDAGVFIRSLASRGSFGGLSLAAGRVADVLDAYGSDILLLETVGMGQVGDDIRHEAFTAVVVLVPESGDGVQVMKAGLLELADILVVNKCDRPGAADLLRRLQDLPAESARQWQRPVIGTSALSGEGITELLAAIEDHRAQRLAAEDVAGRRNSFFRERFLRLAERTLLSEFRQTLVRDGLWQAGLPEVLAGRRSLSELLQAVLARFRGGPQDRRGKP